LKLFQNAWQIIKRMYDPDRPVRLVGISASELCHGPEQVSLFPKERKVVAVLRALDNIQNRYGSKSWSRVSLINTKLKPRSSGFHFDHEI
jgi:hypothetical protein